MSPTVGRLLDDGAGNLAGDSGLVEARREAQILFGHASGASRAWISAHPDQSVETSVAGRFGELLRRRRSGEPIAYLVGKREFYGLEFQVTPDVLIPRADTETLVDVVLEKLSRGAEADVLDLGCGGGCVALTIAHERSRVRVTAIDCSAPALIVAQNNAKSIGVSVEIMRSVWFEELQGRRFDLIASNPPYVAAGDPHLKLGDLRFEPLAALVSGKDGLEDIRRIVADAPVHLRPEGWLMFEHGHEQAAECRDLLLDAGFSEVFSHADIAGIARVAGGRLLTPKSRTS